MFLRYALETFGYTIPTPPPGRYTLVLHFAEVAFQAPNKKVFSVMLNSQHTVIKSLDIFDRAGAGTAHIE